MHISTIEITLIKVRGNNVDLSTIEITSKKVRGNHVDFSTIEITSQKYAEMTWKFVEIWSSTYRRNIQRRIHVDWTWCARWVSMLKVHNCIDCLWKHYQFLVFSTVRNSLIPCRAWSSYWALRNKLSKCSLKVKLLLIITWDCQSATRVKRWLLTISRRATFRSITMQELKNGKISPVTYYLVQLLQNTFVKSIVREFTRVLNSRL